jgi:hypothetical protein
MGNETVTEIAFKGAHLEGGDKDNSRSKFLSVWKDYKEFVAILIFFLSGSLWFGAFLQQRSS